MKNNQDFRANLLIQAALTIVPFQTIELPSISVANQFTARVQSRGMEKL